MAVERALTLDVKDCIEVRAAFTCGGSGSTAAVTLALRAVTPASTAATSEGNCDPAVSVRFFAAASIWSSESWTAATRGLGQRSTG